MASDARSSWPTDGALTASTEEAIIRETLELNDVGPNTSFHAFYEALGTAFRSLEPATREHGAALLNSAKATVAFVDDDSVQSVLTGNVRSEAITKLEAFGFDVQIDGQRLNFRPGQVTGRQVEHLSDMTGREPWAPHRAGHLHRTSRSAGGESVFLGVAEWPGQRGR